MKRILSYALIAVLISGYAAGVRFVGQRLFAARSRDAAGAIFLDQPDGRRFICSGTTIGHTTSGDAVFLTARHCVYEDADPGDIFTPPTEGKLPGPEEVSFSDNEAGPYYTAIPWKISKTDDVALLILKNGGSLPAVRLGDERVLRAGDPLTNYTFAYDFGKMAIAIKFVAPVFSHYPAGLLEQIPVWSHSMPIDGTVAPGSSGSGLFDPRQKALIGVAVGGTRQGGLNIAIPVSRVWNLLMDPNPQDLTLHPDLKIPDDVFKTRFGKDHTFKLTVQGPSPQFTFGGYIFRVNIGTFSLSQKYYYDVPVYIDIDATGTYRLTSTNKGHYSVDMTLVSKAS